MQTPYEKDPYAWSLEQANFLRMGDIAKLDIEHLIEEIETLSGNDKSAIESYLCNYLMHQLKIKYQPEKRTSSWENTIELSLIKTKRILRKNPSFKRLLNEFLNDAYEDARYEAAKETGLDLKTFPKDCPWTIEEILGEL
jgi:hypothetical protein